MALSRVVSEIFNVVVTGGRLLTNVVQDQVFRSRYSGPW